jgi:hypothetical protein
MYDLASRFRWAYGLALIIFLPHIKPRIATTFYLSEKNIGIVLRIAVSVMDIKGCTLESRIHSLNGKFKLLYVIAEEIWC